MFNTLTTVSDLCLLTLGSFVLFFTIRSLMKQTWKTLFLYHGTLFCCFFVLGIGGGSSQNDAYKRFEKFKQLEQSGKLAHAKKNPQQVDGMFRIDLEEFKNTEDFKRYLRDKDAFLDQIEAISLAWFFVLLTELSSILSKILTCFGSALMRIWRQKRQS